MHKAVGRNWDSRSWYLWKTVEDQNQCSEIVALYHRNIDRLFYAWSSNIEASSARTLVGYNINQQGCLPAARQMAAVGRDALTKVSCLSVLLTTRKRTTYLALVRSRITYPFLPWAAMTPPQIFTLQAVQIHGVEFIGNHNWYERLKQKDKHERHRIEPLNLFLQRCNKKCRGVSQTFVVSCSWAIEERSLPVEG